MKNYTRIIALLLIINFLGCNQNTNIPPEQKVIEEKCQPYFSFDQVDHYYYDISESELFEDENMSTKETARYEFLVEDKLNKLSDTIYIKELIKLKFIKNEVQKTKFEALNQIFCERKHTNSYEFSCIPIYRDILVFKDKNKTIGLAKICFECGQSRIVGTTSNTEEFGQSGDYGKLHKLLH